MQVLRKVLRTVFALVVGDRLKVHRIPFGPIAGYRIYMKPSISPRMYLGVDERDLARTAERIIRKSDSVYDVGAHVGYTSLLFGKLVGPGGNVQAFELVPSTAEILKKSLSLNDITQYRVHTVGLGSDERRIRVPRGLTFMGSLSNAVESSEGGPGEECVVVRLDDYSTTHRLPPPRVVKIDIESAEMDALRGARQTISAAKPMLLVEFHSLALLREGLVWLGELGYTVQSLDGSVITAGHAGRLKSFHQTVLCHDRRCDWHVSRLASD